MSLTYVGVVLALLVVAALLARRRWRDPVGTTAGWLREGLVGVGGRPDDDLVERLARCLAEHTVGLGGSHAVPGFLGAVLPDGLYQAAATTKPRLTAEILERHGELMAERTRREGRRHEFSPPPGYTLRLVLAPGPAERCLASFDPIVDLPSVAGGPAALPDPRRSRTRCPSPTTTDPTAAEGSRTTADVAYAGTRASNAPFAHGSADAMAPGGLVTAADEPVTRCEPTTGDDTVRRVPRGAPGFGFALSVDGRAVAQCRLRAGQTGVLVIGRASTADLRCPTELREVSREHAELTYADGRMWVEDKHSANGTWLRRRDGAPERLTPGELCPVDTDDVVVLDSGQRATVIPLGTR